MIVIENNRGIPFFRQKKMPSNVQRLVAAKATGAFNNVRFA